ncbi:SUKH-4 family immunity protein [Streptomyces sp. NPDC048581]|uniref:SUKH-4 family immunity protein n=1 Tax=unclassified Streptomyces TaxID=2593676 RepID=UPI0037203EC7
MPRLVDRAMMESAFPSMRLMRASDDRLPSNLQGAAKSFLTGIGLPRVRSAWFLIDVGFIESESPDGLRLGRDIDLTPFESLPDGAENLIVLGEILSDAVVLDPATGTLYCLPDGHPEVRVLNQNLDTLAYFLYLLEVERPNYDYDVSSDVSNSDGAAVHLRELMIQADPAPFEGVEPAWSETFDWWADDAPPMPTWERVLHEVHESIGSG